MAILVRTQGTQSVPRRFSIVRVGHVIALIVSIGALLGIWGGISRRIKYPTSMPDVELDIQHTASNARR